MTERVRLVVWDLDDTFWRGVLCEGGVTFVEAHKQIVVALARRGVVSSICSKNDFDSVKAILVAHGVWDYFVLPSVSWGPKGPRMRDLIETIGLRAATVMFVDDNPLNLEEARAYSPDLQVRGPDFIAHMLADPLLQGKDDRDLTRLHQYKALELRKNEQRDAGEDQIKFLRDSGVEVAFETDVEAHLDRFVELINRTNQLNFTKERLAEDPDEARRQALALARMYQKQVALIRVRDKYGDHGLCGVYVHNSEGRRLEHFAFSCRILGLGVERWLYQKLGRPKIAVKGEVLADLADPTPVDWVRQVSQWGEDRAEDVAPIARITARGSCEIGAIVHYFRYHCDDAVGEYHLFRDGGVFRIGHSVFLHHAARGLTPAQMAAAKRLGYVESDFSTRLYDPVPDGDHLVILGFGADLTAPLIRHRESGLIVPFTIVEPSFEGRDITEIPEADIPAHLPARAREAMRFVHEDWDFLDLTRPQDFEALLRFAVARIPTRATVCLLAFLSREYVHKDGRRRASPPHCEALNAAMRAVAAAHPHVEVIEVNDLLDDAEIDDRLHFHRSGLFKIYQRLRDRAVERTAAPAGARVSARMDSAAARR